MQEHSFKGWYDEEIKKRNLTDDGIRQILMSHGFNKKQFEQAISDLDFNKFEQAGRGLDLSMISAICELLGVNEELVNKAYLSTIPRKPSG